MWLYGRFRPVNVLEPKSILTARFDIGIENNLHTFPYLMVVSRSALHRYKNFFVSIISRDVLRGNEQALLWEKLEDIRWTKLQRKSACYHVELQCEFKHAFAPNLWAFRLMHWVSHSRSHLVILIRAKLVNTSEWAAEKFGNSWGCTSGVRSTSPTFSSPRPRL